MALPVIRGTSGLVGVGPSGGSTGIPWASGHTTNWLAIAVMLTNSDDAIQAPGVPDPNHLLGMTQCPGSPVTVGAGENNSIRLTAYWKYAPGPNQYQIRAWRPPGADHLIMGGIFLSDVLVGASPFVTLAAPSSTVNPATAVASAPGGDLGGVTDVMILNLFSHGLDTLNKIFKSIWTNASLASVAERFNDSADNGNGGGLAIVSGERAAGGVFTETTGELFSAALQAALTLAVRGAGSATIEPPSDFGCGGECAAPIGAIKSDVGSHWHGEVGAPFISEQLVARNNGRSWHSVPSDELSYRFRLITGGKRHVRAYFRFPTLPETDTTLIMLRAANAQGNSPELRYRTATQDLVGGVGASVTAAVPIVAGRWYECNLSGDITVNPRIVKLNVDGVEKTQASLATAIGQFDQFRIGGNCGDELATADVFIDDIRTGVLMSAYPYGPGAIIALQLTGDGAHVYDSNTDFKYNGLDNVPTGATNTYSYLLGLLSESVERSIALTGVAAGEYLEWNIGGMPAATSIKFLELITGHLSVTTADHKQSLRLISGVNTQDLFTDLSMPGTTPYFPSSHLTSAPGGAAWTTALINALKVRYGSSWLSVLLTGTPKIHGLIAEIEAVGLPTNPDEGSEERNPTHTFPAPGTYPVTLTVEDDSGLTASVTKNVTVP